MNMHADGEQITAIDTRERILLTGATGFLGGSVAAQLIAAGHGANLSFLVRAESRQQGLERLRGNLLMHGVDEADCLALRAEQILCGDFLDTSWLARETPRLMQVERVINCAAVASFSKNPTIWPVNVDGTFAFADVLSRSKRLKRFLHVGTAMCCGPQRESPISESWEFPAAEQQLVDYTASKAEIERRMREELPGLPLVVARPSIVVGHRTLGCQASGSIFWVFRMGFALESFTCGLDEQIDVIPVDYCAEALIGLALKPCLGHSLYHISAGHRAACTFGEIDEAFARANGAAPVGERYRKVEVDDLKELAKSFESRIGPANPRLVLRALRLYSGFADLNYLFDNSRLLEEDLRAAALHRLPRRLRAVVKRGKHPGADAMGLRDGRCGELPPRGLISAVEALDQGILALRGGGQFLAQFRRAQRLVGGLLGQGGDGADVAVDFLGHRALFLRGGGDLGGHLGDVADRLADADQRAVGFQHPLDPGFGLLQAALHGMYRIVGGVLQLGD